MIFNIMIICHIHACMQDLKPHRLWQDACPVPIQELLAALHSGSLEHTLPISLGPMAGRHMRCGDIASMLPSEAAAWQAQYMRRMQQLSSQVSGAAPCRGSPVEVAFPQHAFPQHACRDA